MRRLGSHAVIRGTQEDSDHRQLTANHDEARITRIQRGRTCCGCGSARTVTPGVGGYTLGGGHSPVSRSLRYAVDNLLEAQVVLADGSIATATENRTVIVTPEGDTRYHENGDLLWALRGGGGGTFGIAVYFVYRLHPMPSQMVVFRMLVAIEMSVLGLNFFEEELLEKMPPTRGCYWLLNNFPGSLEDPGSKTMINYKGVLTLFFWMDPKRIRACSQLGKKQTSTIYLHKQDGFLGIRKRRGRPANRANIFGGHIVAAGMGRKRIPGLHKGAAVCGDGQRFVDWLHRNYRKTTEGSLESTPLHPGYLSTVTSLSCGIALADAESGAPLLNQTTGNDELIEYFQTFAKGIRNGMYLNEPRKDNPYWKEDFWGTENYEGLLLIKRRYDPDNFFTCHHCVGSDVMDKTDPGRAPVSRFLF
ncbi:ZEB1-like protein [Mya arenaria]|uniref:ZEB1-like protein n=1 Tax=Mya arenaria TaxID=6604 RepID=A0ABY7FJ83_MYAAR|nr:ZEB1-like protein [Mya arenaria]